MTDTAQGPERPDPADRAPDQGKGGDLDRKKSDHADMLTLEIVFLALVGLVVVAAFFEALTYQLVSSRTPFVIIAPLIVLIVVHGVRLYRHRDEAEVGQRLQTALRGGMAGLNKVLAICLWLVLLLVIIVALGHFVGLAVFTFMLMWRAGGVPLVMSLVVSAGTVVFIYLVFELAFDLELYRGLLFRWLAGYRDF